LFIATALSNTAELITVGLSAEHGGVPTIGRQQLLVASGLVDASALQNTDAVSTSDD
jgi:hypothetical protein